VNVETWPIDRPIPYARNPRKNSGAIDKVAASLKEFSWKQPIVVDKEGVVVVGHTRLLAAKKLGWTDVPVVVASDLTPAQCKAYRISDNRSNEEAEWDKELLGLELLDLNALDFDLSLTAFDADEIKEIQAFNARTEGLTDEDETPEAPVEPVSKLGDLWILGDHRLLCGDSTKREDVEMLMDGQKADFCFTSPPYGVGLDYGEYQDTFENCKKLINAIAPSIFDTLRPGGFCIINFGDIVSARSINKTEQPSEYPMAVEYWPAFKSAGFLLSTRRIWKKPHAKVSAPWTASSNRSANDWEHLWTWLKPGGKFINKRRDNSFLGVWDSASIQGVEIKKDIHPAAFPVGIVTLGLNVYSESGDSVFEPFGGTGTVAVACEKAGRKSFSLELDPKYVDVIVERWQNFTGREAIREDGAKFNDLTPAVAAAAA
jgi:DNA modification methylase